MIRYEIKKIINIKMLLCILFVNILFCALFWIQNKGVEKAKNTKVMQELYGEIGGEVTNANAEKIEALKGKKDDILDNESIIEQEYKEGKISIDAYMKYRDEYHYMYNRHEAIESIYEKYLESQQNHSWMLFDGYYNQIFQLERNQWGLIISVFLLVILLSCCEPKEFACVTAVTQKGKHGVWIEKLRTSVVLAVIMTVLYGIEEYGILASFVPIQYLDAPVQSISCLSNVRISASIGEWIAITMAMRIAIVIIFSGVLCTFLYFVKNKKTGILILTALIFVPMILSEILPMNTYNIISKLITVYPLFA